MKLNLNELTKLHDEDKLIGQLNVDHQAYHDGPGISATNLIDIQSYSEAHFKYWKENPQAPSKAMLEGTLIHTAVLEPGSFDSIYVAIPKIDLRTKLGKETQSAFAKENEGKILISQEDKDKAFAVRDAVHKTSTARALFENSTIEGAFYSRDEATGLLKKAKPDLINRNLGVLVDLKKTSNCNEWSLIKSIKDYRYYQQSAFHMSVVNEVLGKDTVNDVIYIFVEDCAPYGVKFVTLDKLDLNLGDIANKEALYKYAKAMETGIFHGYSEELITLSIFGGNKNE